MTYQAEMDRAYANGAFIPGADAYPPRWQAEAAAFRAALGARALLDRSYGSGERNRFDLFLPEATPRGVMVFVHGGYWLAFGRETWSHLAAGALARGWACAMPSYTLAPEARITRMTAEIADAIRAVQALVPGPVVVTGHSAGGHLSARMGCRDIVLPQAPARVVPISPLADLVPLMQTSMNEKLRLDAAECAAQSPARLALTPGTEAHVWVGGQERPSFLWQARTLSEAWSCPWTVAPGRHHFDVIDDLAQPESALIDTLLAGL
ncbi:alpha/beta hydrolase [Aliigemmobacter aestuarii]|uniref:Alpha/beta hydrolase n=1 Tax=Aliigemmobacter aestuarii TaxID=1445661 RepID=A0A4S3MSR1_9RHOB|nr:alpha/beta hydrolase [Gemmobacter aestuarii]THD85133.1 alpha/beta hydrolase [Gemmobacter aestuarii]